MRYIAAAIGLVATAVAVVLLRGATLSTHQRIDPDSRIELVIHVRTRGAESGQTIEEMAEAQLLSCRLEVTSDPISPLEALGDGRFRVILSPSMDKTNQRQFRGCLEDWTLDQVRADVERLAPIG